MKRDTSIRSDPGRTISSGSPRQRPAAWSVIEKEPLPDSIHAMLDGVATAHPGRTMWRSIDGDGTVLTYGEFRYRSVLCAASLGRMGVGKETHVALMMPNVAGFLISWIALCRLGAVAVMVNTASEVAPISWTVCGLGSYVSAIADCIAAL